MILLSLRGKTEDLFWFAFFHEAGHVLHDNKKDLLINNGKDCPNDDEREVRADKYAAEALIPHRFNDKIQKATSKNKIMKIASELDIAPGIVVGRYQFLTEKWDFFHDLRRKFEWA